MTHLERRNLGSASNVERTSSLRPSRVLESQRFVGSRASSEDESVSTPVVEAKYGALHRLIPLGRLGGLAAVPFLMR